MIFYKLGNRQDYAGYWPEHKAGELPDPRIPDYYRDIETVLGEHLGDPPRKPGKKGDLHKSAYGFFARPAALALLVNGSQNKVATHPAVLLGRESEEFQQFWVLNYVDCLDVPNSSISEPVVRVPGRVGVIKRAAFDEARWDGSDVFVVPQDPVHNVYCSERFVAQWKAAKLKGALFSRFLMDPDAIKA